ncbi:MAG: proliferating cell nuclear antigen (pcna) [Candidatus ainarchaeum sp.]|nr:proliferating cell nuclear antigen (pcna) [Candidatus ainarchaeum sp.]
MKIIVGDAPAFKSAIDAITSLVEEGVFEINKTGLYLKAMDPSQISMVSFVMPKEAFVEFGVEDDVKIGLDIGQLSSVLARGGRGDKVELGVEDGRFVIKFLGEKKRRTFKIPILDIGEGMQKEPKLEFNNHVMINADALREVLKDAKLVSSHIRLSLSPGAFVAEVKGDSGDVHEEFEKDSGEIVEIKSTGSMKATFPLQYLEDITKASPSSEAITLRIETDRPLKVEYKIGGASVKYYLAPRIESD